MIWLCLDLVGEGLSGFGGLLILGCYTIPSVDGFAVCGLVSGSDG